MYRRWLIESYLALKRFRVGYRRGVAVEDLVDEIEQWEALAVLRQS
jgi:hypothetical protein